MYHLKALKNNKGQTMVEFALIAVLFFALLFGIVEFGRYMWYSNHIGNSVRASARYGAVFANSSGVGYDAGDIISQTRNYAAREITGFMNATPVSGTGLPAPGRVAINVGIMRNNTSITSGFARGGSIKVTARMNMQILTGTIIPFFDTTAEIRRSASMPIE